MNGYARPQRKALLLLAVALLIAGCSGAGGAADGGRSGANASAGPERTVPAASSPYASVVSTLQADVPKMMAAAGTVGLMVTLVDGNETLWSEGFGFADKQAGTPVTANTSFHIGSVSKTMTATAVMQLVKEGKVDLDAPLRQYVPEFTLQPAGAADAITVRSVLDHHSGIPGDVFNGLFTNGGPNPEFRAWLVQALSAMYPERAINQEWAYNNSGYVLLANLVEHVTGSSFEEYTRTHVFDPMGMTQTSFDDAKVDDANLTANYSVAANDDGTPGEPQFQEREYINGWAAGSVTSTANEMSKYLQMLLADGQGADGRVLPAGTLAQMWTPQLSLPIDVLYFQMGLGFALGDPALNWAGPVVQHDGATSWNYSMLQLLPGSTLGVFVSGNTAAPENVAPAVAAKALSRAYTAKTGAAAPPAATLPTSMPVANDSAVAADYAGHYATANGLDSVTADADGALSWARHLGTPAAATSALTPLADGWFAVAGDESTQVQFRTIDGRRLLVSRVPWGPAITEMMSGELLPASSIPAAWAARLGTYLPVDAEPRTTSPFANPTATLADVDGVLMLQLPSEVGSGVLQPASDRQAFTFGIGPALGRGKGNVLQMTATGDSFVFLGVTYRKQA
ncbi:MAG: class A beta-lactamase-related serine hydrolase [Actinobacteria bacterium]|nr:MAG: class A beta-lactamase-related serine hydrolase [Actinomycetota bacterium]